jgi:hypothetical protein
MSSLPLPTSPLIL